jgi:transposase
MHKDSRPSAQSRNANKESLMVVLGIDVSKAKLDAALWLPVLRKWYACKVDNDEVGLRKLLAWALAKSGVNADQIRVVLEATGVYHELAAETLHDAGCHVVVANPKRARDFSKGLGLLSKTDTIDARALARYGELSEAQAWQPPAPEVRTLRALLARLAAVEEDLQREQNRWEKAQISQTPEIVRQSLQQSIEVLRKEAARLRKAIDDVVEGCETRPRRWPCRAPCAGEDCLAWTAVACPERWFLRCIRLAPGR